METNLVLSKQRLFTDQLKILYKNLSFSLPANLVCSGVVTTALYLLNERFILTWFLAVILITVMRAGSYLLYYLSPQHETLNYYMFLIGVFLSALMWGILCSYLMPYVILEQIIIVVVIAGITSGGLQSLHADLTASIIFVCTIVIPLCVWLFLQSGVGYFAIGFTMVTYLLFMIFSSLRGYKVLQQSLSLSYENVELIEKLSNTNKKLTISYNKLEHNHQKMEIITKMNELLQSCKNLNEAYDIILFTAKNLFEGFDGALTILNELTQCLEIKKQWGEEIILPSFAIDDCWALRQGHNYIVSDIKNNFTCFHFKKLPNAYICLPINTYKSLLGLVILHSNSMDIVELSPFLSSFTENIQLSLSNIHLKESLYEQSIRDPLTGLFNRRQLDKILIKELDVAKRNNNTLCVAMLDIDFFKKYNDQNGHEAGDEVLKTIANILKQNLRVNDYPCRFGGEELLMILVNSTLSNAKQRLEKISDNIRNSKVYFNNHLLPPITVSIGIAEAPRQGDQPMEIIQVADEALYQAKKLGRNCVVEKK